MDVESRYRVHDRLCGHIDRHRGGCGPQRVGETWQSVFEHKHRFGLEAGCREKHVEHHLALGDEAPLPAGEVAFANGQVGRHARVGRVVDADDFHAQLPRGLQRAKSTELATTETEENAIAAPASTGDSMPDAASGMPIRL